MYTCTYINITVIKCTSLVLFATSSTCHKKKIQIQESKVLVSQLFATELTDDRSN